MAAIVQSTRQTNRKTVIRDSIAVVVNAITEFREMRSAVCVVIIAIMRAHSPVSIRIIIAARLRHGERTTREHVRGEWLFYRSIRHEQLFAHFNGA